MNKVYYDDYSKLQNVLTKKLRKMWIMLPMYGINYVYPVFYFVHFKVNK